jgi:hypothetical protein
MSSQIIPLNARADFQDPNRIPAMETTRVMMGGDVTVTSEPGKGSVFTVRLPVGATH